MSTTKRILPLADLRTEAKKRDDAAEVFTFPGRTAPHSVESEESLLSCCLLDGGDTLGKCIANKLKPSAFFIPANRVIFAMLESMRERGLPLDMVVLAEELKTIGKFDEIGGMGYLLHITTRLPTTAQATYFLGQVAEKWILRRLISEASATVEAAFSFTGGLPDMIETLGAKLARMGDYARRGDATLEQQSAIAMERSMKKAAGMVDKSKWLFTGLETFDRAMGPFDVRNEDWFCVIAGIQSSGKSSLIRKFADFNLNAGKKGLVFLLETSMGKWLELAACTAARINARYLDQLVTEHRTRFEQELKLRHGWIGKQLWICDEIIPVETITARIEEHVRRFGPVDFIVIDHLHLLRSREKFKSREPEVGYCAKELKRCFKSLDVTGFVAAQLNRDSRKGEKRAPASHDIRDSGEVEQAADRIDLIYTPTEDCRGAQQTINQNILQVEIIQDKSRNGPTANKNFWLNKTWTHFYDMKDSELSAAPARVKAETGYGREN